jgi:hypothetical protein
MTISTLCLIAIALCAISSVVASIVITADLDRRGIKTSWPLMRWYFFRNLSLYREETLKASGKVGPLFYWFVVSINAAWFLALLAWALS